MENFFTDIDLVTTLCRILNYEEQFKLCQVSSELSNIIANYVWKTTFKEMEIIMSVYTFLVSDTITPLTIDHENVYFKTDIWRKKCFLSRIGNLELFLKINQNNIQKLQLIYKSVSPYCTTNVLSFRIKFPNLTELYCWNFNLELHNKKELQAVAEDCLKLESLCIHENRMFHLPINNLIDNNIQSFKKMRNLNKLFINIKSYKTSRANIKNFINQLKLQHLTLNCELNDFSASNIIELNLSNLKYYKELHINCGVLYKPDFLKHFENLCMLTLSDFYRNRNYNIDEEFFEILLKSCKGLRRLHLKYVVIYHFKALATLTELILEYCDGLSNLNLKTILSKMQLKYFKTIETIYKGSFENFLISPSLETIEIYSSGDNIMKLLKFNEQNLSNLKELRYKSYHVKCDDKLIPLNFAKNLKVLNINAEQLFAEDCLKLKCLQKIEIFWEIEISEFLLLLKHENLRELSIDGINTGESRPELKALFKTNLRYLCLHWSVMENIADFLLELLDFNRKLSLAIDFEPHYTLINKFLEGITSIISNRKFPKRFKNINVCGVSMDCNSIRNNCADTMEKIKILASSLPFYISPYLLLE